MPNNVEKYFELKRMIPIPFKKGYISKLKADFDNKKCWFELEKIPPTELEVKLQEEEKLNKQLQSSFDILLQFLEGEISITEYAKTQLDRKNIRNKIKTIREEINKIKVGGNN